MTLSNHRFLFEDIISSLFQSHRYLFIIIFLTVPETTVRPLYASASINHFRDRVIMGSTSNETIMSSFMMLDFFFLDLLVPGLFWLTIVKNEEILVHFKLPT